MDSKMLLTCALDIGEKMLISGAEISRVEYSVKRICNAWLQHLRTRTAIQ